MSVTKNIELAIKTCFSSGMSVTKNIEVEIKTCFSFGISVTKNIELKIVKDLFYICERNFYFLLQTLCYYLSIKTKMKTLKKIFNNCIMFKKIYPKKKRKFYAKITDLLLFLHLCYMLNNEFSMFLFSVSQNRFHRTSVPRRTSWVPKRKCFLIKSIITVVDI